MVSTNDTAALLIVCLEPALGTKTVCCDLIFGDFQFKPDFCATALKTLMLMRKMSAAVRFGSRSQADVQSH